MWGKMSRTTGIIIAVGVSSVISRFPYLGFLFSEQSGPQEYDALVIDIAMFVIQINSSFNIVFYMISKQFRHTVQFCCVNRIQNVTYELVHSFSFLSSPSSRGDRTRDIRRTCSL